VNQSLIKILSCALLFMGLLPLSCKREYKIFGHTKRYWRESLSCESKERQRKAIIMLSSEGARHISMLRSFLRKNGKAMVNPVSSILLRIGPESLPHLKEMIISKYGNEKECAALTVVQMGDDGIQFIINGIEDESYERRRASLFALIYLRTPLNDQLKELVIESLIDEDAGVRDTAILILWVRDRFFSESFEIPKEYILFNLKSEYSSLRASMASLLKYHRIDDVEIANILKNHAFHDSNLIVRVQSAVALLSNGYYRKDMINILYSLKNHENEDVDLLNVNSLIETALDEYEERPK